MHTACRNEIIALHALFGRWFRGDSERSELARIETALAEDFRLISPRGIVDDRATIVAEIAAAHGKRSSAFEISVSDIEVRASAEPLCVVTYEEHQAEGQTRTRRLSTALFRRRDDAPLGVEWVHMHETWAAGE